MNRPWIIWNLSGLCAFLVFGAMGLITRHTLSLEKERARAEAKAEFEGWVRLALWRMDSSAAGILAEENNRPASHFRDVDIDGSDRFDGSNVKLHFELNDGVLSTPLKTPEWGKFQKFLNDKSATTNVEKKSNLDLLCAVALGGDDAKIEHPAWASQVELAQQQRAANAQSDARNAPEYQINYNRAEKAKRQVIVNKAMGNGLLPKKKQRVQNEVAVDDRQSKDRAAAVKDGVEKDLQIAQLSPLTAVWLDEDLILVREVKGGSGMRLQGAWLDADAIRESLLQDIEDLLPHAQLVPVRQSLDMLLSGGGASENEDPMVMVALPWRLLPGEMTVVLPVGWTPMRQTLAVAWVGAILAALAAVILLRGVIKLSERRASFVSSVTHELRTPLTTFSLYSDMLAEGMIQDEEKKQDYLLTLRRESARLTHLVENVLAYSRIERGSARTRVERVRVGEMLDRMLDRLRVRAEEAEMQFQLKLPDDLSQREIKVDTTAIEQIIFNLVDNASKYASGEGCGDTITLRVLPPLSSSGKGMRLQVCDQGRGIQKSEHRRLFRAFHKSAQEAAHTKPGVGLGLALSRRLARALGGDLKIIEQECGACFELTIE